MKTLVNICDEYGLLDVLTDTDGCIEPSHDPCDHQDRMRLPYLSAIRDANERMARGERQRLCTQCWRWRWNDEQVRCTDGVFVRRVPRKRVT